MVLFRADGNGEIGSGHVMRCLSLALALKKLGRECLFVCAQNDMRETIENAGFRCVALDSDYRRTEAELSALKGIIAECKPRVVVVDSYYASDGYIAEIGKLAKTAYIDDLAESAFPADYLINYSVYARECGYDELYKELDTKLLLGCEYAPLREQFSALEPTVRAKARRALVAAGGSDPLSAALAITAAILRDERLRELELAVVCGSENGVAALRAMDEARVTVCVGVSQMARLMQSCDIAVSAGGSTLYELCACGLAAVSFSFADNQLMNCRSFDTKGIIPYAGDFRDGEKRLADTICDSLAELVESRELRRERSARMKSVCDGRGAERLARALIY